MTDFEAAKQRFREALGIADPAPRLDGFTYDSLSEALNLYRSGVSMSHIAQRLHLPKAELQLALAKLIGKKND